MSHFMSFWHRFSLTHVVVLLWIHFTIQNYLVNRYVMCIYLANSLCWSFWLQSDNRIYKIKYTLHILYIYDSNICSTMVGKEYSMGILGNFLGTYMVSTF